jgi:hypothetical protein
VTQEHTWDPPCNDSYTTQTKLKSSNHSSTPFNSRPNRAEENKIDAQTTARLSRACDRQWEPSSLRRDFDGRCGRRRLKATRTLAQQKSGERAGLGWRRTRGGALPGTRPAARLREPGARAIAHGIDTRRCGASGRKRENSAAEHERTRRRVFTGKSRTLAAARFHGEKQDTSGGASVSRGRTKR